MRVPISDADAARIDEDVARGEGVADVPVDDPDGLPPDEGDADVAEVRR